jgi:hypothetical protein
MRIKTHGNWRSPMAARLQLMSGLLGGFIVVGCAATPHESKPAINAPQAAVTDPTCLDGTGTRLPANSAKCSVTGRSYSHDDINRTGATDAGEALRLLDPSITVQR